MNCLLAGCECKGESEPIRDERGDLTLPPDTVAELGRQAGNRDTAGAIPPTLIPGPSSSNTGRYSNTAAGLSAAATSASSNHTTDTVSQLHSRPRRIQSSWSKRVLRTMITMMLLLASILKVEGNSDWRESAFQSQSFDCNTPVMIDQLHEVYIRTIGGKISAEYSRSSFPTDCSKNWSFNCPQLYLLDDQAQACTVKRIQPVSLKPEETSRRISDNLSMLYNESKTDVLLLPGCPQLIIHHTSPGTASTTSDERAAELLEALSLDVRSDQYLIQTLCCRGHQDCSALSNPNNRVEHGDGTTWLDVTRDQDYLYRLSLEPGWLARRKGENVYKELCKRIEVPNTETPIVF